MTDKVLLEKVIKRYKELIDLLNYMEEHPQYFEGISWKETFSGQFAIKFLKELENRDV